MKLIKKLSLLVTTLIMMACLFLVGCRETEEEQKKVLLTDKTKVELNLEESVTVAVTTEGLDESKIIWKSENENIATVSAGVISPVAIGATSVTVSYEEQAVVISVEVKNTSGQNPNITLGDESISLYEGDNFQLTPKLSWGGKEVNGSFTYESSESDTVSVTDSGYVTANALGSATITVTSSYKGITVTEEIVVNVVYDAQAQILVDGVPVLSQDVEMCVGDSYTFTVRTLYNEQEVTGLEYTLASASDKVDKNQTASTYSFTAKAIGQDTVTVSCEYNGVCISTFIQVNVVVRKVAYNKTVYVDLSKNTNGAKIVLPAELPLFDGTQVCLTQGTTETVKEINKTDNYVVIDDEGLASGSYNAVIGNEHSVYNVTVCFADKVFMQEDVQNFSSIINANLAGYYVLGEDITFSDTVKITTIGKKIDGTTVTFEDFTGVFDGCGFAMKHVQLGAEGGAWYDVVKENFPYRFTVFAKLNGGTVKNLYVDYQAPKFASISHLSFIGDCRGNVENVYVKLTVRSTISKDTTSAWGVSALINRLYNANGNKVRNCVGEVVLSNVDDTEPIILSSLVGISYTGVPISNCYGVTNGYNLKSHFDCTQKGNDGICGYYTNATIAFANVSAVNNASNLLNKSFNKEDGWAEYWQVKADGLYFGNTLIVAK